MYRLASRSRVVCRALRRLSTDANKDISTEEKASEVGQALWKKFQKYGLIIVPGTFITVLSIDVINKPHHRDWVEELWPSYIHLMREYYGFDDEDPAERARLAHANAFLKGNHKLRLSFAGSVRVVEYNGQQSVRRAVEEALGLTEGELSASQLYTSSLVTVLDDEEAVSSGGAAEFSGSTILQSAATVAPLHQTRDSLWQPALKDPSLAAYLEAHGNVMDSSIYTWKFRNTVRNFYMGLQAYGRHSFLGIRALESVVTVNSNSPKAASKLSMMDKEILKQMAVEQIAVLEGHIKNLEMDKQRGREVDVVEQEIAVLREQIQKLRRTHLNYFYFF